MVAGLSKPLAANEKRTVRWGGILLVIKIRQAIPGKRDCPTTALAHECYLFGGVLIIGPNRISSKF